MYWSMYRGRGRSLSRRNVGISVSRELGYQGCQYYGQYGYRGYEQYRGYHYRGRQNRVHHRRRRRRREAEALPGPEAP